ncbi:hypothetical protein Scep_001952 [Stephania cephalantha]|uniref:MULE transposase domain-containing protein n=1 Tax=Stephania cephalantha TaxID=152367 RepID=A0AAP0L984_9MAGN
MYVLQLMSVSTLFPDYKDAFTPCRPFPSRESAISWLQMIGRENKFVLVTKHSDAEGIKRRGRVKLACERSGAYRRMSQRVGKGKAAKIALKPRTEKEEETGMTQTGTKKCGCHVLINIKENVDSLWYVTVICGRHNHDPAKNLDDHSFAGILDKGEQVVVVQMTKGNVKPRVILNTLKQRDVKNVSTMRTIYNARQKFRIEDAGGRTQMQQLLHILEKNKWMSWHRKYPDTNVVTDLFWSHPDSIKLLRCFSSVILMDCTYKTNMYRMPLLEIVGITSTHLTFSVGFAFISSETHANYVWALENLRSILDGWPKPDVFVTDRELGLISAIEEVCPSSSHLLCSWHINKVVLAKTKKMFGDNEGFARFMDRWTSVLYAKSDALLELKMNDLRCEFGHVKGLTDYLDNTWVKIYKEKFVPAWTNRIMHFGETTTQRVESAHSTLKLYLGNSQANFETLWRVVDGLLRIQHNNIKASFELSTNVVQHEYFDGFYRRLLGYVSQMALKLIRDELERGEDVGHDSTRCG